MHDQIKKRLAEVVLAEEHIKKARLSLMRAIEAISDNPEESDIPLIQSKILSAIRKEGGRCSRKRIGKWWLGWGEVGERVGQAAIDGLERDGIIEVELSNANRNRGELIFVLSKKENP